MNDLYHSRSQAALGRVQASPDSCFGQTHAASPSEESLNTTASEVMYPPTDHCIIGRLSLAPSLNFAYFPAPGLVGQSILSQRQQRIYSDGASGG
jgi:hypothetical protein